MPDLETRILETIQRKGYQPVKAKALAKQLNLPQSAYGAFRTALRELLRRGRAHLGKNSTVRPAQPFGTVTGVFRRTASGHGFVRPHTTDGRPAAEIAVADAFDTDASTGDEVVVRVLRKPGRGGHATGLGEVTQILERA